MPKVRCDMEAGLVRHAPRSKQLIGIQARVRNRAEEVHPPLRALCRPIIHVEEPKRDAHVRDPGLRWLIDRRIGGQAVNQRIGNEEVIERRALIPKPAKSISDDRPTTGR